MRTSPAKLPHNTSFANLTINEYLKFERYYFYVFLKPIGSSKYGQVKGSISVLLRRGELHEIFNQELFYQVVDLAYRNCMDF